MPGDAFQTVLPGQKLQIPAMAYNAFLDAARFTRAKLLESSPDDNPEYRQTGIIKVRNDSGEDRERFDVLGLDAPVIGPSDNLQEFQSRIILSGDTPIAWHKGRFAILLEPLRNGRIGRAVVSGITVGRVWIEPGDPDHGCADIRDDDPTCLEITDDGAAQVLWRESGYGKKWALLRLGQTCPCGSCSSSSSSSSIGSGSGPSGVEVRETDIRCESGQLNVYTRISTLRITDGQLVREDGTWSFDHRAGCCSCDKGPSSSSSSSSSSFWSSSGWSSSSGIDSSSSSGIRPDHF